jgi:hypothetical protein
MGDEPKDKKPDKRDAMQDWQKPCARMEIVNKEQRPPQTRELCQKKKKEDG